MIKVDQQEKHSRYENGTANLNPETKMFNNKFKFDAAADIAKSILEADVKAKMEALKGDQVKLDKNRNGKLDAQDFKMLRGEKKVNEAEANYQSSYRVGKTANFKPKASDVGQGRKITGKMGKYGKQPDDDNMVEPPPEHKVGDVKTDPSAVVPGHSTMGAKLHLASLPKDAEGNTIHKGARRVNAADLVAKRKAMMAGQKNEEVEEVSEGDNLTLRGLVSTDPKNAGRFLSTQKGKENRAKRNVPELKSDIKRQLGRHPKPNLPEEAIEEGMEDTLHPAGAALLKHIKPEHHNLYKPHLTKDVFNGGFGDRHAVLKAAQDAGHLKMDLKKQNEEVEELEEALNKQHTNFYDKNPHFKSDDRETKSLDKNRLATKISPAGGVPKVKKKSITSFTSSQKNEEVEELDERELTAGETAEKEKIVHGMKKSLKGFKARYGDRAKEVMYATATKQAKKD